MYNRGKHLNGNLRDLGTEKFTIEKAIKNLELEMENSLGLLRIRVRNGVNIAVRDVRSSDTYVVVTMGEQVCSVLLLMFFINYDYCYSSNTFSLVITL